LRQRQKKKLILSASKARYECAPNRTLVLADEHRFTNSDLQTALRGKWILVIGDSSLRMLWDYLAARLTDQWGREWPSTFNNHGPPRGRMCQTNDTGCTYDAWISGVRLTFVWQTTASYKALATVGEILGRSTGGPDVVFLDNGPWENVHGIWNQEHTNYFNALDMLFCPHNQTWPPWTSLPPLKVFFGIVVCTGLPDQVIRQENWDNAWKSHINFTDWVFFERDAFDKAAERVPECHDTYINSCRFGAHHPGGEILAGIVDVLASVLQLSCPTLLNSMP